MAQLESLTMGTLVSKGGGQTLHSNTFLDIPSV